MNSITYYFYGLFADVANQGYSFEEIEELFLERISNLRTEGYDYDEIEEALEKANDYSIEYYSVDLLNNFGEEIVNRFINCLTSSFDEYGNLLPEDISCN